MTVLKAFHEYFLKYYVPAHLLKRKILCWVHLFIWIVDYIKHQFTYHGKHCPPLLKTLANFQPSRRFHHNRADCQYCGKIVLQFIFLISTFSTATALKQKSPWENAKNFGSPRLLRFNRALVCSSFRVPSEPPFLSIPDEMETQTSPPSELASELSFASH